MPLVPLPARSLRRSLVRFLRCLALAWAAVGSGLAADWEPIQVPGAWEENGPAAARAYDGVAWYRTWVKVHDSFFTKHERNLYEESVSLNLRQLADAHEVFVNGNRLGGGGRFPPDFQGSRGETHRHKVPVGTLRKGEWNEIAIRVYNATGPGGFLGEAPFLMNYFLETVLEGAWEFRLGDGYQPGGAVATRPARTGFEQFRESNRVLGRSAQHVTGPRLSPADSWAQLQAAPDLRVDLLLSEPLVAQPNHLSFDARGRLWVTQYRQYPYPAGVRMISRDKYYRSHYDRIPPAPPHHDRGADVISIHEDTDGDGIFDRHSVFQDGLNLATAAVRGHDGVWVMNPPYLLFYPDRNFDDRPDAPPEVHLQGFGLEDTHSVANGLVLGPDGWLYGCQGSTTSSRVTRRGMDPPDQEGVYFEGCMVWRYHPGTREYEIFAEGSGNTFGLELDADGRLFSGHNGGETRGWHYVQGGFYLMQGVDPGKFGPPRHPYAFGDLPKMPSLTPVVRFSHFLAVAEGTALPPPYQGNFLALDPLHNAVIAAERRPRGASFETRDVARALVSTDTAFRPLYITNAPDGSLYVSDMYEYYIAHGQHYQSQIDPSTGRIYRLRGRALPLESDTRLADKATADLVPLLAHPNKWHRHTAGFLLGERRDPGVVLPLRRLLAADPARGALNALWALQQMDALDDDTLRASLRHSYAPVRLWAVRLLGDRYGINRGLGLPGRQSHATATAPARPGLAGATRPHPTATPLPEEWLHSLQALAREETDAEVRSQLAASARRLATADALRLLAELIPRDGDLGDPYLPALIWWLVEAHVTADRTAVLAALADPALWSGAVMQQHVLPRLMRRFALEGRRQDLLVCAELLRLAPTSDARMALVQGWHEAFRGRPMIGLPDELVRALATAGPAPLAARVRAGERAAIREALAVLRDARAALVERIALARTFGEVTADDAVPLLLVTAQGRDPIPLRKAALVSLQSYDQPAIAEAVARLVPSAPAELRIAALSLLASRVAWSALLLEEVAAGRIAADSLPADLVDRLRAHDSRIVRDQLARLFPSPAGGSDASGLNRRMAEVRTILQQGTGDPYRGETVFSERCAACHKLFFKGGRIGPDLTGYQRDNLETLLFSIINPNAEVREGFQSYLLETRDGRTLGGFLVERDPQVIVLRGLDGEDVTVREADIRRLEPVGRSLMPEGLLDTLAPQALRDLFAYLRISQPISR